MNSRNIARQLKGRSSLCTTKTKESQILAIVDKKSFPHLKIQWLSPCSTYLIKPTWRKQIAVFHLVGATLFKLIGARIILLPFLSFLPFISHSSLYFPLLPLFPIPPFPFSSFSFSYFLSFAFYFFCSVTFSSPFNFFLFDFFLLS